MQCDLRKESLFLSAWRNELGHVVSFNCIRNSYVTNTAVSVPGANQRGGQDMVIPWEPWTTSPCLSRPGDLLMTKTILSDPLWAFLDCSRLPQHLQVQCNLELANTQELCYSEDNSQKLMAGPGMQSPLLKTQNFFACWEMQKHPAWVFHWTHKGFLTGIPFVYILLCDCVYACVNCFIYAMVWILLPQIYSYVTAVLTINSIEWFCIK